MTALRALGLFALAVMAGSVAAVTLITLGEHL